MLQRVKNMIWMLYYGLYFWFYLTVWRPVEQWWRSLVEAFLPRPRQKQIKQSICRNQDNKPIESPYTCHFQKLFLHLLQEENQDNNDSNKNKDVEEDDEHNKNESFFEEIDLVEDEFETKDEFVQFVNECCIECYGTEVVDSEAENILVYLEYKFRGCDFMIVSNLKKIQENFRYPFWSDKQVEDFMFRFFEKEIKSVQCIPLINYMSDFSIHEGQNDQQNEHVSEQNQDFIDSKNDQENETVDQEDQENQENVDFDQEEDQDNEESQNDQENEEMNREDYSQQNEQEFVQNSFENITVQEENDKNESIDDHLIVKDINQLLEDDSENKKREEMDLNPPDSPIIGKTGLMATDQVECSEGTVKTTSSNQNQSNNQNFSPQTIFQEVMKEFDPSLEPSQQMNSIIEKLLPKFLPPEKIPKAQQFLTKMNTSALFSDEKNSLHTFSNQLGFNNFIPQVFDSQNQNDTQQNIENKDSLLNKDSTETRSKDQQIFSDIRFFNQDNSSELLHAQFASMLLTKKSLFDQDKDNIYHEALRDVIQEEKNKLSSNNSPSSNVSSESKRVTEEANQTVRDLLLRLKGPSLQYFHGDLPFVYSNLVDLSGPIELYLAHIHQLDLLSCRVYWSNDTVDNIIVS